MPTRRCGSGWSTASSLRRRLRGRGRLGEAFVNGPAYALRAAKESIDLGLEVDLDTGLAIERQQFTGLFATEDRTIGMTSFVENGPGKAEVRRPVKAR